MTGQAGPGLSLPYLQPATWDVVCQSLKRIYQQKGPDGGRESE